MQGWHYGQRTDLLYKKKKKKKKIAILPSSLPMRPRAPQLNPQSSLTPKKRVNSDWVRVWHGRMCVYRRCAPALAKRDPNEISKIGLTND